MPKKSLKREKPSLVAIDVQGIFHQGILILVHDQEFFLSFSRYPCFKNATVDQIYNVQLQHDTYLHWPALDIDLDVDSLKHPDAYPLIYK